MAIIGSGFGGLGAAVRLRQAGITNFSIFERASEVGGTWHENTYPGCRCDVKSTLYSFSFAPNPSWSNTYSYQPEIFAYLRNIANEYQLREVIKFEHEVLDISFDSSSRLLRITTQHGVAEARHVILAAGGLAEPRLPDIEGIESFAGPIMHTAKWRDDVVLDNKRVAVIGTGASAIQVIPQIAASVRHLSILQRTPPWILPHMGHAVRKRSQLLFRFIPFSQQLNRFYVYWRNELMVLGFVKDPSKMKIAEQQSRLFLESQITDPQLRESLTPHYRLGCKRVLISNDYYPSLRRDNVALVTSPITGIEPEGVRTSDGTLHKVDVLISATGFYVTDNPIGERVHGARGEALATAFRGTMSNYRGTMFPDFPNLFMLGGPNTALGHSSIVFMLESQLNYVVEALKKALRQNALIEPTQSAADEWTAMLQSKLPSTVWGTGCASWYLNERGINTTIWPDFTFRFRKATRHFQVRDHHVTR